MAGAEDDDTTLPLDVIDLRKVSSAAKGAAEDFTRLEARAAAIATKVLGGERLAVGPTIKVLLEHADAAARFSTALHVAVRRIADRAAPPARGEG